jgi:hypothetical protein
MGPLPHMIFDLVMLIPVYSPNLGLIVSANVSLAAMAGGISISWGSTFYFAERSGDGRIEGRTDYFHEMEVE